MAHTIHLPLGAFDEVPSIAMPGDPEDELVHILVGAKEQLALLWPLQRALPGDDGLELPVLRRIEPIDRLLDRGTFQCLARELAVEHIAQLDRRNKRAVLRKDFNEAFFGK